MAALPVFVRKNNMKKLLYLGFLILPLSAFAADAQSLEGIIDQLIGIINSLVPLLFGFALIGFMWGVVKYIASGNAEKIKEARKFIIFSIVAIAVMMSVWSIAYFLKSSIFPRASTPFDNSGDFSNADLVGKPCILSTGKRGMYVLDPGGYLWCGEIN
jgi:hypothetical protein